MLLKFMERERIYEFLAGLNAKFDQVRVQILGKEEVPSLSEVFSIIRAEEGMRSVMLDSPAIEGSALAVTKKPSSNNFGGPKQNQDCKETYKSPTNKDNFWCNYCKKPRHTKEMCWKLKGKSSFGKNNNQQQFIPQNSQANAALNILPKMNQR